MFNLTRHEKAIIAFLSLAFLLGTGVLYFRKQSSRVELKVLPQNVELERRLKEARLVNINEASPEELIRLPGIGPVLAKRILDYRRSNGPFRKIEDIKNVEGIGPKKFIQIKEFLAVE